MEPDIWLVKLRGGSTLKVAAHAWGIEGDELVFSLLCRGQPPFEVDSLRIPRSLLPKKTMYRH
ncbi:MAG: hypothetical protein QM572_15415 [Nocardioides sp.]|uniref:hypothetical protein n=1 Tax=Nocardioides sp. TaxID=35761 RepID=UPI0039E2A558